MDSKVLWSLLPHHNIFFFFHNGIYYNIAVHAPPPKGGPVADELHKKMATQSLSKGSWKGWMQIQGKFPQNKMPICQRGAAKSER